MPTLHADGRAEIMARAANRASLVALGKAAAARPHD
jgi:hypothetical protein